MDASAVLASAEDRVIDEGVAALARDDQADGRSLGDDKRRDVRQLFRLVVRCMRAGRAEPVIRPCQQIAAHSYAAGLDLAELLGAFNVLAEVLWRRLADALPDEQLVQALRLLNAIVGAGKDAMARTYADLAIRDRDSQGRPSTESSALAAAAPASRADGLVAATVTGQVGIITLQDRHKRNAIGTQLAAAAVAALESLQARQARAIVLRAAEGMDVWSAGHDIGELPPGRRDPLGYNDPLEELIRAVRTCPAPVVAMVHGTVWGGALDLFLSCDLAVADETASFAITPANLGLPYNITGSLAGTSWGGCPSTSSRRCSSPPRPSMPAKPRNGCSSTTWSPGTGWNSSPSSLPRPWPPSHRWPSRSSRSSFVSCRITSPSRHRCTNGFRASARKPTTAATTSKA